MQVSAVPDTNPQQLSAPFSWHVWEPSPDTDCSVTFVYKRKKIRFRLNTTHIIFLGCFKLRTTYLFVPIAYY